MAKKVPEQKDISDVEGIETEEEVKEEIKEGELNKDVYTKEGDEELEEEDEISELEEGFMKGYNEIKSGECAYCGKVLTDNPVEINIKKESYWFCSSRCADKFKTKKKL